MLLSVEGVYREQTAQTFSFALTVSRPMSFLTYSFLDDEALLDARENALPTRLTLSEILTRKDDVRRRLSGRCKGLLELVENDPIRDELYMIQPKGIYGYSCYHPRVDFLHRTVYDFMSSKEMQKMLAENLKPDFDANMLLCKANLAQLKALDYDELAKNNWLPTNLLEDLLFFVHSLEATHRTPQLALLDEVQALVLTRSSYFRLEEGKLGFLEYVVPRRLHLYMAEKLKAERQEAQRMKDALLKSALTVRDLTYFPEFLDLKMIEILLQHGASASRVWTGFIRSMYEKRTETTDVELAVAELLIEYGADPQERIVTQNTTENATSSFKGRASAASLPLTFMVFDM